MPTVIGFGSILGTILQESGMSDERTTGWLVRRGRSFGSPISSAQLMARLRLVSMTQLHCADNKISVHASLRQLINVFQHARAIGCAIPAVKSGAPE